MEDILNRVFSSFFFIFLIDDMNRYFYNGPVLEFDRIIDNRWSSSTIAESEKKARSNLAYQYKIQTGRAPRSKITIPGKLIIEGGSRFNG